jgi:acetyl esterase/lipase
MTDESNSAASIAKSLADRVKNPVVYRLPGMDKVRVISNLRYSEVDNPYLLMDVYVPPDLKLQERRPVVVFIHGGAGPENTPKDWGIFQSWGRLVAAAGMIGVMFTHRFSPPPESLLTEAASDVSTAIEYLRANAASFHANADRVGVCAWSSGGALLSALLTQRPEFLRCLVAFYAMLDLQQYAPAGDTAASQFLKGFSGIAALPEDASRMMPMLIVRAGRDEVPMLNDALDRFAARALKVNAPITVINHPSGEHGFDNQSDDEGSRKIIRSTLEFMKGHLGIGTVL